MKSKKIIEILIDKSGSMGSMKNPDGTDYKIEGIARIFLIKRMLLESILPMLTDVDHICVRTFRTKTEKKEGNFIDTPQIITIYNDKFQIISLSHKIISIEIPEQGGTPITAALEAAEQNLRKYTGYDKKIILLTDGEENGGGNFIEISNRILSTLENCKIFLVGIALDEETEKKVLPIATGGYINIKNKDFLNQEVRLKLKNLSESLESDTLEKLIDEKERIENLIKTGIDSTTITIDEDYSSEICRISEKLTYDKLCNVYNKENVNWLNINGETFNHYDFEILNEKKEVKLYIECKGTKKNKPTFYMTDNEWMFFLDNKDKYYIYRVSNIDSSPEIKTFDLLNSIMSGDLYPMLIKHEILKPNRVFLTIKNVS